MMLFYFVMALLFFEPVFVALAFIVETSTSSRILLRDQHYQQGCNCQWSYSSMNTNKMASSSSSSSWDENSNALLNLRLKELKRSESLQDQLFHNIDQDGQDEQPSSSKVVELPVICMDAMLPKQKLQLRTTDPTFGCFLRDGIGLGGIFVMVSLNPATRLIRRHGTCVKLQALDVVCSAATSKDAPTAVDFEIVGLCRCRLVGPPREGGGGTTIMRQRIGRWRRGYDPNGEESMLGWDMERFQESAPLPRDEQNMLKADKHEANIHSNDADDDSRTYSEWSTCLVHVGLEQMDQAHDERQLLLPNDKDDFDSRNRRVTTILNQLDAIAQMLVEWQALASNVQTFENLNVTATTRIQRGHAGLRVNPQVLIKNVLLGHGHYESTPAIRRVGGSPRRHAGSRHVAATLGYFATRLGSIH
jgi:hypothetical protein